MPISHHGGRLAALRGQLLGFEPADDTEAHHLERMHILLGSDGEPCSRDRYDPGHFTASAFVLDPTRSRLALVLHGKLHRWLQPGGHIDLQDASVVDAAKREVAEEIGITQFESSPQLLDVDVHPIPARKGEPQHFHFDVRYLMVAATEIIVAESDAQPARWFQLSEVQLTESDASVMRAVKKIRALLS